MDAFQRQELQELVTRLADGDRSAFARAFALLKPLFEGYLRRHLPLEEAEEVTQRSLLQLFRRSATFDPARDALSFCLGIATWEMRSARQARRRRAAREVSESAAALEPDPGGSPEEAAIARDLECRLGLTAAALSPLDAATLAALIHGRPDPAVAPVTFRKRLSRAIARLKTAWRTSHGLD